MDYGAKNTQLTWSGLVVLHALGGVQTEAAHMQSRAVPHAAGQGWQA